MSNFLRKQRELLQMSQNDLATMLKVSQQTVARWEKTGQIPSKYVKDLAIVLSASAQDFLPGASKSAKPKRGAASPLLQYMRGYDPKEHSALMPFGDVRIHFAGDEPDASRHYPVTRGALNRIQEQLMVVDEGAFQVRPWVQFEALNNKWVAINMEQVEQLTFVDDAVEEMSDYEHEEVYSAAMDFLLTGLPSDEEVAQEDFPYSAPLIEGVRELVGSLSMEDALMALEGVSYEFVSGRRTSRLLSGEVAATLDGVFSGDEGTSLDPKHFLDLTYRDEGAFEHVRLGALRLFEVPLLAFDRALEGK
jgi:transcriptional regulator with XRE-family HTH domain